MNTHELCTLHTYFLTGAFIYILNKIFGTKEVCIYNFNISKLLSKIDVTVHTFTEMYYISTRYHYCLIFFLFL